MRLQSETSFVQINILRRSRPESTDFEDGNWLESEIKIDVYGFKALYGANLRADDFQWFHEALVKLNSNLTKEVEFTTMEEGLYLKGKLDVTGNIKWEGAAKSEPAGNRLTFSFETDNASIGTLTKNIQFGLGGDDGDRWRTTGLSLNYKDWTLAMHFATGDPGPVGIEKVLMELITRGN